MPPSRPWICYSHTIVCILVLLLLYISLSSWIFCTARVFCCRLSSIACAQVSGSRAAYLYPECPSCPTSGLRRSPGSSSVSHITPACPRQNSITERLPASPRPLRTMSSTRVTYPTSVSSARPAGLVSQKQANLARSFLQAYSAQLASHPLRTKSLTVGMHPSDLPCCSCTTRHRHLPDHSGHLRKPPRRCAP